MTVRLRAETAFAFCSHLRESSRADDCTAVPSIMPVRLLYECQRLNNAHYSTMIAFIVSIAMFHYLWA
jgi:hypothetical protein